MRKIIIVSFFLIRVASVQAQWYSYETLNLSFENIDGKQKPVAWQIGGLHGDASVDNGDAFHGAHYLRISTPENSPVDDYSGYFSKQIPAKLFIGTTITVSGYIRTTHRGRGGFWISTYNGSERLAYNEAWTKVAADDSGWTRCSVSLDITGPVSDISFGGQTYSAGTACFDSITVYCNDRTLLQRHASFRPDKRAINWLKNNSVDLASTDTSNGLSSLNQRIPDIKSARIVSMGDFHCATHETFEINRQILGLMASNGGTTFLAVDLNTPEADRINRYVQGLESKPFRLIEVLDSIRNGLWWPAGTQEFLETIRWVQEFNKSGKGKIVLTGYGIQTCHPALLFVQSIAGKVDQELYKRVTNIILEKKVLDSLVPKTNDYSKLPQGVVSNCLRDIKKTIKYVQKHESEYLATLSREDYNQMLRYLKFSYWRFLLFSPDGNYDRIRDSCMALNMECILDNNPGSRIMLWGSNIRVTKKPGAIGYFLNKYVKGSQIVIGLATNEGSYTAYDDHRHTVESALTLSTIGSYEYYATMTGNHVMLTDLRNVKAVDSNSAWLTGLLDFRRLWGWRVDGEEQFATENLQSDYDMILFVKKTTGTSFRKK